MKALVTGASGFIGHWLLRALQQQRVQTIACVRRTPGWLSTVGPLEVEQGDIRDSIWVAGLITRHRPDVIFHLAAQSLVPVSWERPQETCEINVIGTVGLLEVLRRGGFRGRLILACSSAEYAAPAVQEPLREEDRLWPSSIYGASKFAADKMGELYAQRYGLDIVRVRPFFLIGPGKKGDVASDFARGIVAVERGEASKLEVGNLEVVRDFMDVRDGVDALVTCATKGEPGAVYNVCSGKGWSIRQLLEAFLALARCDVKVEVSAHKLRRDDEPYKVGDPTRLLRLGWRPRRALNDCLRDILDFWRAERR